MTSKKTPPPRTPKPDRKPLPPDMQKRVDASLKRNEEALRRLAKL
jgi:hypothetical protein